MVNILKAEKTNIQKPLDIEKRLEKYCEFTFFPDPYNIIASSPNRIVVKDKGKKLKKYKKVMAILKEYGLHNHAISHSWYENYTTLSGKEFTTYQIGIPNIDNLRPLKWGNYYDEIPKEGEVIWVGKNSYGLAEAKGSFSLLGTRNNYFSVIAYESFQKRGGIVTFDGYGLNFLEKDNFFKSLDRHFSQYREHFEFLFVITKDDSALILTRYLEKYFPEYPILYLSDFIFDTRDGNLYRA